MDVDAARRILGVSAGDDWSLIRDAYRARIRGAHPDVVGDAGTDRAATINLAYRTLTIARREGRLRAGDPPDGGPPAPDGDTPEAPGPFRPPTPPPPTYRSAPSQTPADDVRLLGDDTIVLSSPPAETFRRLLDATHALGEISYVDRSAAIFEAILHLEDGTHASFVVSLQWRAHDASCEAFCTLEALERAEHLDVSGVLEQLLPFIPPDPDG